MNGEPGNDERARKRARTSFLPTADLSALLRDAKLWFSDGNIILACGNTGFCVHAGVLSLNSWVFKDMLASGTPSAGEVYEGIDVVRLSDDVEDMRLFLTPMYYQREGPMHSVYRVAQLKALLEMARKYMANGIQLSTLDHLRELFPSSIERARTSYRRLRPSEKAFDPWTAVEVSVEHDIPIILPMALYYTALRCNLPQTLDLNVSREVTRRVLLFREAFSNSAHDLAIDSNESYFEVTLRCPDSEAGGCTGVDDIIQRKSIERHRNFTHDIFTMTDVDFNYEFYPDLCPSCDEKCSQRQRLFAERLWEKLPMFCDGSDWLNWIDVIRAHLEATRAVESEP